MCKRRTAAVVALVLLGLAVTAPGWAADAAPGAHAQLILRGRNIVLLQRCNECHTAGYARSGGKVPLERWLTGGDRRGFRGPWGVTHAPDLRARVASLSESQWIRLARTLKKRPPMPEHNLSDMSDEQLKAVYWFIKSLGPGARTPPR